MTSYKPHTAVKPLSWKCIPKRAVTGLFDAHTRPQGHFCRTGRDEKAEEEKQRKDEKSKNRT